MIEKIYRLPVNENKEIQKKLRMIEGYFMSMLLKEIDIFKNEKKSFAFKILIDNIYILFADHIIQNQNIGISKYFYELIQNQSFTDNIIKIKDKNVGRIEEF
ncbi:MAG: hypothetical protein NZ891_05665, partial [bacterium]|nr:hypothetical protein [bacterium]MDW8164211.1 hypothetical protein [Candidatus Omnitrophota bacterium]